MSTMVYKFKENVRFPGRLNAQDVGNRLSELRESEGAGFGPELVLADARRPDSPTHAAFTWDDTEAAQARRLQQASYLIRAVVVVYQEDDDHPASEVRAFVPVVIRDVDESRYLPIIDVISDEEYRRQYADSLMRDLLAIRRKGSEFAEFTRIWRAIDTTVRQRKAA